MKLSLRSYPHPVVGNRDDVPGSAFQAAVEMSADKENVYLSVDIQCSSLTIKDTIAEGAATYVLHVECSNTLFRKAFRFSEQSVQRSIPAENLNDQVEVNVFVAATKAIGRYKVENAHADYGEESFEIKEGDVLAVGETVVFPIESEFDSFSRIGSIMQIEQSTKDGDGPMETDLNGAKIRILLSKNDFKEYKILKGVDAVAGPLTATIVLPVLIEALHQLNGGEFNNDEADPKWVKALRRRIADLSLKADMEPLVLAQRLLELPLKRSLAASRAIAEAQS